jgi:hypothetical protein
MPDNSMTQINFYPFEKAFDLFIHGKVSMVIKVFQAIAKLLALFCDLTYILSFASRGLFDIDHCVVNHS